MASRRCQYFSHVLQGSLSAILPDTLSCISSYIVFEALSDSLSGISSDILSGASSDISLCVSPDVLSDILSGIASSFLHLF